MQKLMKQSKISRHIEKVQKKMNSQASGEVVLSLTGEDQDGLDIISRRLMSEDSGHFVLIKGLKQLSQRKDCLAEEWNRKYQAESATDDVKDVPKAEASLSSSSHQTVTSVISNSASSRPDSETLQREIKDVTQAAMSEKSDLPPDQKLNVNNGSGVLQDGGLYPDKNTRSVSSNLPVNTNCFKNTQIVTLSSPESSPPASPESSPATSQNASMIKSGLDKGCAEKQHIRSEKTSGESRKRKFQDRIAQTNVKQNKNMDPMKMHSIIFDSAMDHYSDTITDRNSSTFLAGDAAVQESNLPTSTEVLPDAASGITRTNEETGEQSGSSGKLIRGFFVHIMYIFIVHQSASLCMCSLCTVKLQNQDPVIHVGNASHKTFKPVLILR